MIIISTWLKKYEQSPERGKILNYDYLFIDRRDGRAGGRRAVFGRELGYAMFSCKRGYILTFVHGFIDHTLSAAARRAMERGHVWMRHEEDEYLSL